MPSYLFLWNPTKDTHSFRDYNRVRAEAEAGKPYVTRWICPSRRPRPGDIAYLQRTGPENNGVFARGVVTQGAHDNGNGVQVVRLTLDSFLPLGQEIARARIVAHAKYRRRWMPMASGNVIPEPILHSIEALWPRATRRQTPTEDDTDALRAEELVGLEGQALRRMVLHRKRERSLRDRKIADTLNRGKALVCEVPGCGFDFARVYGSLGVGYAQVHHLFPLAQRESAQPTALSDLAIVCANCHAMIHRGGNSHDLATLIPRRSR
jgi:5-methylcytosine-specific restriction endonuclease McrA